MSGRGSGSPVLHEVACSVLAPRSGWQCYLTSVLESSPAVEVALVPFRIPPLLGFDPSSYLAGLFQQLRYLLGKRIKKIPLSSATIGRYLSTMRVSLSAVSRVRQRAACLHRYLS